MKAERKDIESMNDVKDLVDTFYSKVRHDEIIGPVFQEKIKDEWAPHLEKMYAFWGGILLGKNEYRGRPFPPHMSLSIDGRHFRRWLELFHETVDEMFTGPVSDEAIFRSVKIAQVFMSKLAFSRGGRLELDDNTADVNKE